MRKALAGGEYIYMQKPLGVSINVKSTGSEFI